MAGEGGPPLSEFQVIYLTGAPAAGKSSTARALKERVRPLEVWEFGERLRQHLSQTTPTILQDDLRRESARVISPTDVAAVDRQLVEWTAKVRGASHVVIDSHPVTKEQYGFRVTPYSLTDFARLAPTRIWVLYCSPEVTLERIGSDAAGRPMITLEEARMHTQMQASVAVTYGMSLGVPVHLFDSACNREDLLTELVGRF